MTNNRKKNKKNKKKSLTSFFLLFLSILELTPIRRAVRRAFDMGSHCWSMFFFSCHDHGALFDVSYEAVIRWLLFRQQGRTGFRSDDFWNQNEILNRCDFFYKSVFFEPFYPDYLCGRDELAHMIFQAIGASSGQFGIFVFSKLNLFVFFWFSSIFVIIRHF